MALRERCATPGIAPMTLSKNYFYFACFYRAASAFEPKKTFSFLPWCPRPLLNEVLTAQTKNLSRIADFSTIFHTVSNKTSYLTTLPIKHAI